MGNGESTSRRICMQRSEEGTIQISEDVMLRLNGEKTKGEQPNTHLLPGEKVIDEDDLRLMLEKAFQQGISHGSTRAHQQLGGDEDSNKDIKAVEQYWKKKLEEQERRAEEKLANIRRRGDASEDAKLKALSDALGDDRIVMNDMLSKLQEETNALQAKFARHEKELQTEFHKSAADVQQRLSPLQQVAVCSELQSKVLECYRENKEKPLRCSQEVKDFASCVQASRLKFMQSNLLTKENSS